MLLCIIYLGGTQLPWIVCGLRTPSSFAPVARFSDQCDAMAWADEHGRVVDEDFRSAFPEVPKS
jgi:hypothetical protein